MDAPRHTIAVASGKGGVGKSTVSLNLALALAGKGGRVGVLDADVYGPDIPLMVGLTRRKAAASVTLWSNPELGLGQVEPVERFGIKLMSTQFLVAEEQPLAWDMPLVDMLLDRFFGDTAWGDLDYLIVDLPPGTADLQQQLAKRMPLSGAVIVVTPQDVAHLDAKKVVTMFRTNGVAILGGIENMSGLRCPHCAEAIDVFPRVPEDRSIWAMGVECLGTIPLDPETATAGDRGRPVVIDQPDGTQAAAFRAVAERVADAL